MLIRELEDTRGTFYHEVIQINLVKNSVGDPSHFFDGSRIPKNAQVIEKQLQIPEKLHGSLKSGSGPRYLMYS